VTPHLVHISPTFELGGAEIRTVQLIEHFGARFRHTIVALNGDFTAADRIRSGLDVTCVHHPGRRNPVAAVRGLARRLDGLRPDLVLTYNWGSMDGVIAATLSGVAPVIHTEDGFGEDEAGGQKTRRVWYRRLALARVFRVIAPSRAMANIMRRVWRLRPAQVEFIPNGVDLERYTPCDRARPAAPVAVGAVGRLGAVKRYDLLLEACASLAPAVAVAIAGDGPERSSLESRARALGFNGRARFLGRLEDLRPVYRSLDLLALSSSTEQMPISVLEAMACGLPIVSTDVGDIREMVSDENRPFIATTLDAFRASLQRMASDAALRLRIGAANRRRCAEVYSAARMFERYRELYESALRSRHT